jgi:hypothetical protein
MTILQVLLEHNSEFNGEDLQMGLILRKMNKGMSFYIFKKNLKKPYLEKEYTIGANAVEPVPTTAPKSLLWERIEYLFFLFCFGLTYSIHEKSLLVQRIFSWDVAAHHFILDFLEVFKSYEVNIRVLLTIFFRFCFLTGKEKACFSSFFYLLNCGHRYQKMK